MTASESGPDDEEDVEAPVLENKLTSDNLAEGFRLLKPGFGFLHHGLVYDGALKLKQMVEEVLVSVWRNEDAKKSGKNKGAFL